MYIVSDTDMLISHEHALMGVGGGDWHLEKKAQEHLAVPDGNWFQLILSGDAQVRPNNYSVPPGVLTAVSAPGI